MRTEDAVANSEAVRVAVPSAERCSGNCDAARRLAALRALLQLVSRDGSARFGAQDAITEAMARAFERGCTADTLQRSGVMPSEIAMAAVRLLL